MNYRNLDLLDLAKHAPHCMSCLAHNDGTLVAAHANHVGKGIGMKSHDFAWAAMCFKCHARLDQGMDLSREQRRSMWERAYWRTQEWLWSSGKIYVAAEFVRDDRPEPIKRKVKKSRPIQSRGFQKDLVKGFDGIVRQKEKSR